MFYEKKKLYDLYNNYSDINILDYYIDERISNKIHNIVKNYNIIIKTYVRVNYCNLMLR